MGKKVTIVVVVVVLLAGAVWGGYVLGVQKATTAEGWLDEDADGVLCFWLEVEGNVYVWDVSEEEWGDR